MRELRLELATPVAELTIDRAAQRNALTQQMWRDIPGLIEEVRANPGVRVLVVRSGTPGTFSAGADIEEYRANAGDTAWGLHNQDLVGRALAAIRGVPIPTVAAVDGPCIGGGCGIAVACDFRIASSRSRFAITPAKLGLVYPAPDTATLVALIGPANAKRMLLTGAVFDASWAIRSGLLDEVHDADDLADAVAALVAELVAVAPGSARAMKAIIDSGASLSDPDELVAAALRSRDHLEGVTAFLARRPPKFGDPV
jgi:enoyl-CoA hydratase/carnithine racemase